MVQTNRLTTKSIFHKNYTMLCFFVVFFQPLMLWDRVPLNYFFNILQFLAWAVIALTALIRIRKWDTYLWVWTAFCIVQIVVILNNVGRDGAEPVAAVETIASYFFLVHFLDIFFSGCGKKEMLFFWKYLFMMLVLEVITIPLYQVGIVGIYWLGIKTRATEPIIAFLLVNLILKDKMSKKMFYLGIALSVLVVFGLRISTGIIGLVLIGICWWLLKKPHLKWFLKLLQPTVIIVGTLALTMGVLYFDIQTHFSTLFGVFFSKDATFSGRAELWEYGITMLTNYDLSNKLWGFGFYNIPLWCRWKYYTIITEGHNQLIQMLHDTGIIGAVMLYGVWFLQLRGFNRCKNIDIKNIIASVCFVMLIMCITEIYCYHSYYFIIFSIAARSKELVENLGLHQFKWRKET